jgi:isopenicillin N synthase-like dioxygenase
MTAVIPLIDFYPFLHGGPEEKLEVAKKIADACLDIGFFSVTNHGVDARIIDEAWRVTGEYFDLPDDEKRNYHLFHYFFNLFLFEFHFSSSDKASGRG